MQKENERLLATNFYRKIGWFRKRILCEVNYLALLNLSDHTNIQNDVKTAVAKTKEIIDSLTPHQIVRDMKNLLSVRDWRPHLIVCVSLFFIEEKEEIIELLWQRLDETSWVAPQIIVSLSYNDKLYNERSRKRLFANFNKSKGETNKSHEEDYKITVESLSFWSVISSTDRDSELEPSQLDVLKKIQSDTRDKYFDIANNWYSSIGQLVEN